MDFSLRTNHSSEDKHLHSVLRSILNVFPSKSSDLKGPFPPSAKHLIFVIDLGYVTLCFGGIFVKSEECRSPVGYVFSQLYTRKE